MLRVRDRRRRAHHRAAARHRRDLRATSPAAPPTSPTGRTSSCTGSGSRTCPRSGARLEAVGLQTTEACGDCPRVILGSPVAGIARDEIIDPTPADRGDHSAATSATRPTANLPRKFKTAITGHAQPTTSCTRSTTSRFVGVVHPELGPGYDLWVGGGLSTNPRLAVRLGAFVAAGATCRDVWPGVVSDLPRLRLPPDAHTRPG